jgi:xanthine dehydrogenase small subunit
LQDFFIEYGKQDLRPGECVESVHIPARPEALHYAVYKLSRRFDQDISSLCAAFSLRLENGVVVEPRICFGGMAGTPKRASKAEQALAGRPWDQFTVKAAQNAMQQDYTPLSDWRGSREYRMQAAQNLLQRFFLETTGHGSVQLKQGAGR